MNIKEMIAMKPAHTPEELEQAVEDMIVFNGLIHGEDPAKLDEMRRMLYRHYQPEGFERIFVEDILRGLWKYRRYQAMEYWMTRMEMEQMKAAMEPGEGYDWRNHLVTAWKRAGAGVSDAAYTKRQTSSKGLVEASHGLWGLGRARRRQRVQEAA